MNVEEYFILDINFEVLKAIAYRWGLQDKSIQKIQFYAGAGKPYVLLFSFSEPTIEGLWGHCINGLKDWQSGWLELNQACIKGRSQKMRNWLIFAHDQSENQYFTSEYCWRNGKNDDYFKKDPDDIFGDEPDLLLTKKDFVGDSWILTESGFKKHVLNVEPKTIYQSEHSPAKDQKQKLFDKYVRLANEFMAQKKEQTGQAPSKDEFRDHLENLLKKNDEALGPRAKLPEDVFRRIWGQISTKRDIGEKTRHTRK